jgi:hypothetical protein
MDWFKKRLAEPSTYAGLAAVILGGGQLAKISEAPAMAEAVASAAPHLAAGDWMSGLMIALGSLAMILKDKGGK